MLGGGLLADSLGFSAYAVIFGLVPACALLALFTIQRGNDGSQINPEQPSVLGWPSTDGENL
ncbi:MAG: hypothetical protein LBS77_01460 [Desulfovibrio sp.]|jgi:hypothetical protein|nr:hypothetical protein [Desulfovibrio sp.]